MRFLVDENLGVGLALHLRSLGHDAASVAEVARGASDEDVLALALKEERILVTEDKDFGRLVFARSLRHAGVMLLKLRHSLPTQVRKAVGEAVGTVGERLRGRFAVVGEGVVRLR
ncbi:MAG TPA: DUF5615 family PIN-like protein [Planctomycetota bacterium]|nr:DUF5615 family PIN-like protein [Planctomycetota bacterium]